MLGKALSLLVTCTALTLPGAPAPTSIEDLSCMSWAELEQLYRQLEPGPMPCGFARGKAFYCPCEKLAGMRSHATDLLWKGKHFSCGSLVNQWPGVRAIHARVCYGESWLDGKPAIIMDYRGVSRAWNDVRDEMRQVCPGLYLGAMYLDHCPCPKLKVFFALETSCP